MNINNDVSKKKLKYYIKINKSIIYIIIFHFDADNE